MPRGGIGAIINIQVYLHSFEYNCFSLRGKGLQCTKGSPVIPFRQEQIGL